MRKSLIAAVAIAALAMSGFALATPSPNGPGQPGAPGVTCGSQGATTMTPGFGTQGFTDATLLYAGSPGTPSLANGNVRAVSQYDIACFQATQH